MELSGLYAAEELGQSDGEPDPQPAVKSAPSSKPRTNNDGPERPWTNYKQVIDAFAVLHGRLGPDNDHVYKEVLQEYGVEHSNKFPNYDTAKAAYRKLRAKVEEIEAAREQQTVEEIASAAEGDDQQQNSEATI
jgi:hypothetical protein